MESDGSESTKLEHSEKALEDIMPKTDTFQTKHDHKHWQLKLFGDNNIDDKYEIVNELRNLDIKNITPIEALNKLFELQKKLDNNKPKTQQK